MLREHFGGATETLILVPKKNGKTTLMAALALYHLATTPDAECVIAAASRDQAAIMLRQARGFIRRNPGLQKRMMSKQREIVSLVDEGRIRVLAADADTADGVLPTLALVDELHRHRTPELYGVFRDGLGPRDGKMITISTAGDTEDSPLGEMRKQGYALKDFRRDGAYRFARSPDGGYVMHEWALDGDDDRSDMKVVKRANPAPWQTTTALRRRFESPTTTPWQWARFACGVWLQGENSWLPTGAWHACYDPKAAIPEGARVTLGVDIGTKTDTSALVRLWERDDGKVVVEAEVFSPAGDGTAMEIALVEDAILAQRKRYKVRAVVYDKWSFERSAQELSGKGFLMIEQPMSPERMAIASQALYQAVMDGKIVHAGDPVLAAHVLAGTVKQHERGWRLVKGRDKRPIDALIAMALAYTRFIAAKKARPTFEVLA